MTANCANVHAHHCMRIRIWFQAMICVQELVDAQPVRYAGRMTILADNISILVDRAGGQTELGREIGVPQSTISRWLGGVVPRNLDALGKAAEIAGVTIDDLMSSPLGSRPIQIKHDAPVQHLMLPVSLPSEERLASMMRGLLRGVGLEDDLDEHAETLARRLPNALAQAASDLVSDQISEATSRDERAQPRAKPGHDRLPQ